MSFQNLTEEQIESMINLGGSAEHQSQNHEVQRAHFSPLLAQPIETAPADVSFLDDVEVELQAELGHTLVQLREVLALRPDQIIDLNRLAGDMVDLKVNNIWLARGEVLVLKDTLGIRITSFKGDRSHPGRGAK